jgi:hypothetical protein
VSESVRLATRTPREDLQETIVGQLERLLERARRGELESFAAMYETSDFEGMNWIGGSTLSRSQTIGRFEILKARLIHELLEGE